jgi:hypothetical protein
MAEAVEVDMAKIFLVTAGILVVSGFRVLAEGPTVPPVFTATQAEAGRAAYQSVCFNCHQPTLAGRKGEPGELPPIASLPRGMQNDIATAGGRVPPLAGSEFMARWAGRTTADLAMRMARSQVHS